MKKGLAFYFLTCVTVLAVMLISIYGAGALSVSITDSYNAKYLEKYAAGEKGISSPWYRNGYHIVDEGFLTELNDIKSCEHNVIAMGSSLSVIGIDDSMALSKDYELNFLVCGNGNYKSDELLYNLANAENALKSADIIKLEISYSTFREKELTIAETIIDKWGKYSVSENGVNVSENTGLLSPIYDMNLQLIRIQNIWELAGDALNQEMEHVRGIAGYEEIVPGNFRNNYFNYNAVAATCDFNPAVTDGIESLIKKLASEHILIVEYSPMPKGLCDTEFGANVTGYIDDELTPFLEKNKIPYLDYRRDYSDDEFADGVHLGYNAGKKYAEKMAADLSDFIDKIN